MDQKMLRHLVDSYEGIRTWKVLAIDGVGHTSSIRSVNRPNVTSGIRSILFYKVSKDDKTAIYTDRTYALFDTSDTHSSFELYYDVNAVDEYMDSYLIVVKDYAGNVAKKKLICRKSLLTWFHTSIDRSSYKN